MAGANDAALRPRGVRTVARLGVAVAGVALTLATATCTGTTGMEGLLQPGGPDAAVVDPPDASLDLDSGDFDVVITYVDRTLPDVVAPVDAGAEAGYPWPTCAPFIPVGADGTPVALGSELNQVPAVYEPDGGESFAPDGSACASYGWLGSTGVDDCVTSQASGFGPGDFPFFPPCNWCAEAGVSVQGPGAGLPLYDLCLQLYSCAVSTGCGSATSPSACLCGSASAAECIVDASGPCATEELAALQATASGIQTALTNYTQFDPQYTGYCGSALNFVFQNARTNGCFALLDGAAAP